MLEQRDELIDKFSSQKIQLSSSQVKQIAGRAGRYGGVYSVGEVTAFHESDMEPLKDLLNEKIPDIKVYIYCAVVFSSLDHEVLRVSYCDQSLSFHMAADMFFVYTFLSRNIRSFETDRVCRPQFDEDGRKFPKLEENTVEKGEIAHNEQFLLFPQYFQKTCTACKKWSLFGKGINENFGNFLL